jgi:hypothetical protein
MPMGAKAGDGARTHDPQLGKLMLYQLSYAREACILAVSEASTPLETVRIAVSPGFSQDCPPDQRRGPVLPTGDW